MKPKKPRTVVQELLKLGMSGYDIAEAVSTKARKVAQSTIADIKTGRNQSPGYWLVDRLREVLEKKQAEARASSSLPPVAQVAPPTDPQVAY